MKTQPLEWYPDNKGGGPNNPIESDCYFEETVLVASGAPLAFEVEFKLTHFGTDLHYNADQELPAVWLNGTYETLATLRTFFSLAFLLAAAACFGKSPVDYVNPMIGTAEHGHVYPGATVPFGMVQLSPDTRDNTWDGCSGYHYSDTSILGFSHNHLTGTGCPDLGNVLLMPTVGDLKLTPAARPGEGYRARFSHAGGMARPGYYSVLLPDYQVKVELTATARAGFHRYTFPATTDGHVMVDLQHGIGNKVTEAQLTIEDDHTASGYRRSNGWGGDKVYYFVMEFSRPFDSAGVAQADKDVAGNKRTGKETKGHFDFKTRAGEQILVRVGLSTVSVEGARKNLRAEIPGWDFDAVAKAARKQWDKALSVFDGRNARTTTSSRHFTRRFITRCSRPRC